MVKEIQGPMENKYRPAVKQIQASGKEIPVQASGSELWAISKEILAWGAEIQAW